MSLEENPAVLITGAGSGLGRGVPACADGVGGLNVLVNNAGIAAAGNCEDTPVEDWRSKRFFSEAYFRRVVSGSRRLAAARKGG